MLGFLGVTAVLKVRDGMRAAPVALAVAPLPEPDLAGRAAAGVALQAGRNGRRLQRRAAAHAKFLKIRLQV